jgi:hypothetical protein
VTTLRALGVATSASTESDVCNGSIEDAGIPPFIHTTRAARVLSSSELASVVARPAILRAPTEQIELSFPSLLLP